MSARAYADRLAALVAGVAATNGAGEPMPLDAALDRVVADFADLPGRGAKAMFVGNGGSAAIASHFATDFTKNGGIPTLAFTDAALLTCISNDLGYENVYAKPVESFGKPGDVLLAISSSGRSENILRAARLAAQNGLRVVTMSGFAADNPLRALGTVNFHVDDDRYGFVECGHFVLCHVLIDRLMGIWPESGS